MMNDDDFRRWIEEITSEMAEAKERHKERVWKILKRHAQTLARLSPTQLREVKETFSQRHFCEERDIDKALLLGNGQMPAHVFDIKAITARTWRNFPARARRRLENPTNTVEMRRGSAIVRVPVSKLPKLKDHQVRKLFSANHPQIGLLGPDDEVDRSVRPRYYSLVDAVLDGDEAILTFRMGRALAKARVPVSRLRDCANSLVAGRNWSA